MKCKQCGTEFTGNYCPECGAKNEELYPQIVPKKLNILKRNKNFLIENGKISLILPPSYFISAFVLSNSNSLYTNLPYLLYISS